MFRSSPPLRILGLFCLVCLLGFFACEKDEFVPFPDSDGTLTVPPPTVATSIRQLSGKERKTLINQIVAGETGKSFAKSQIAYLDSTLSAPAMVVYDSLNDSDVYTFFLSKPAIDTIANIVVEIPRTGSGEVYSFVAEYVMEPSYAQDLAAEVKTIQQYEGKVSLYPIGKLIDYQQKCGGKCNSVEKCLEIVFGVPVSNGGGSGTGTGDGPGSVGTLTYSSVILSGSSGDSGSNTGGNTGTGDSGSGTGDGGAGDGGSGTGDGGGGMPPLPSEPGCYELLLASGPYLSPEDRLRLGTWNRVPCPAPTGGDENIGFPDTPTERMPSTSLAKDPDLRDCCTRLLTSVGILTGPLQNEDEEYFQRIHEFSVAYGFNYGRLLQLIDRDELNACTTGSSDDCIFSQIFDYLDQELYTDLPVTPGQIQAAGVNRTYLQSNPDQAAAVFRFVRQYEGDAAAGAAARVLLEKIANTTNISATSGLLLALKSIWETGLTSQEYDSIAEQLFHFLDRVESMPSQDDLLWLTQHVEFIGDFYDIINFRPDINIELLLPVAKFKEEYFLNTGVEEIAEGVQGDCLNNSNFSSCALLSIDEWILQSTNRLSVADAVYVRLLSEGNLPNLAEKASLEFIFEFLEENYFADYQCIRQVNDHAITEKLLSFSSNDFSGSCSFTDVIGSFAQYACSATNGNSFDNVNNESYLTCVLQEEIQNIRPEIGFGTWIKLAKVLKKAFKALKQGKNLRKGSTWKDIFSDVFDTALNLVDGQVTPDEIIEAILDLGLGLDFDDLKWIKRLLGFSNDAFKFSPTQIDNALDFGVETTKRLQHRMRHFQNAGWIPSSGSYIQNVQAYRDLVKHIMNSNPVKTFEEVIGGESIIKSVHYFDGNPVVISVYKTGPFAGKIKQTVRVNEESVAKFLALPDYIP